MNHDEATLRAALTAVEERVAAAAVRAGRAGDEITLIGVTKRHPAQLIELCHAVGLAHIGENYAQELVAKHDQCPVADQVQWHFIGHLQRNKVKEVVGRAAFIHAVDSARLAQEIAKRAAGLTDSGQLLDGRQRVLVAVNVGGEEQKSGVAADQTGALLDVIAELSHITCVGLMTMPPFANTPEDNRAYFRQLAALREQLAATHGPLPHLSMGTTGDFEVAIEEGATMVRVGTALFGTRPAK
ncbi:MAG: YggS family pyridoxal phosphate-dependent enzyme [Myxococcota bacterium]